MMISPPAGSRAALCSQALGCSRLSQGLTFPLPKGFSPCQCKSLDLGASSPRRGCAWQVPQAGAPRQEAEPCPSSSTAGPLHTLLFRECQCWDTSLLHILCCCPHTLVSKPPSQVLWRHLEAHRGVAPFFQPLELMRRSCGVFNPFLWSLFPVVSLWPPPEFCILSFC